MNVKSNILEEHSLKTLSIIVVVLVFSTIISLNSDIAIIILWISIWGFFLHFLLMKFPREERGFLTPFIIAGLFIRLMIAILFRLNHADTGGLITPDEFYYYDNARSIVDAWKSGAFLNLHEISNLVGTRNYGYHIYDALHFMILEDKLLPVISNVFLDTLTSLIIFKYTSKNFGKKLGKLSFLLIIFNPYLIYWSTFNLKDTILTFLIALFVYILNNAKKNIIYIASITLLLISFATLRFYVSFIFIVLLGIIGLLNHDYKIKYKMLIGATIGISIFILIFHTPMNKTFNDLWSEGLRETAFAYSSRSLAIAEESDYSTQYIRGYNPESLLISTLHAFLAPSPLNWEGDGKYLFFGTIIWYLLLPYYFIGSVIFLKNKKLRFNYLLLWLFPLTMITVMIFLPSINESRHRLVMIPYATILATVGISYKFHFKKAIILAGYLFILAVIIGNEIIM